MTYALADYEPSINLMPFLFYQTLNLPELKNTRMAVHMVDWLVTYPRSIIEDLLVKFGKLFFPIDFVVLDMKEDEEVPIILGSLLLNTPRALIDIIESKLTLWVGNEEIKFGVDKKFKNSQAIEDEIFLMDGVDEKIVEDHEDEQE